MMNACWSGHRFAVIFVLIAGMTTALPAPAATAEVIYDGAATRPVSYLSLALDNEAPTLVVGGSSSVLGYPYDSPVNSYATNRVDDVLGGLPASRQPHVKTVVSEAELQSVFDDLASGGTATEWTNYKGTVIRRPDGVEIGIRPTSRTGGPAVDIRMPGQDPLTVHIEP